MVRISLFLLFVCFVSNGFKNVVKPSFEIEIIQDEEIIDAYDNEVTLQKKPFIIKVKLYALDDVLLNAQHDSKLFDLGQEGDIPDFRFINTKVMAEEKMNANKELVLSPSLFSSLRNSPETNRHHFDSIQVQAGHVIGFKTVSFLDDHETGKRIEIEKVKKDLYLFFVATSEFQTGVVPQELGRKRLILKWD